MARPRTRQLLVRIPSSSARLILLLGLGLPACAHMPWATQNSQSAHAGPLPAGDDPSAPPPAPFEAEERSRIHEVDPYVAEASTTYELDPNLIHGVIWVESRHQPRAKSPAGARGLMQLMPATAGAMARDLGRPIARVYDPAFNVQAGSLYLSRLLEKYEGDETLALAAYNAGPGNVDKWLTGDGLPPRSLEYVALVQDARRRFEALNGQWSLPLDETPQVIAASDRRPTPSPSVPTAPPPAEPPPRAEAASNPLAPSPDVYKPTPPPEPPLFDTPYPPIEERPARGEPPPRARRATPSNAGRNSDPPAPDLPSVLD